MTDERRDFSKSGWRKLNPNAADDFLDRFLRSFYGFLKGVSSPSGDIQYVMMVDKWPEGVSYPVRILHKRQDELTKRLWNLYDDTQHLFDQGRKLKEEKKKFYPQVQAVLDRYREAERKMQLDFMRLEKLHPRRYEYYMDLRMLGNNWMSFGFRAHLDSWDGVEVAEKAIEAFAGGLIPVDWRGNPRTGRMVCMYPPNIKPVRQVDQVAASKPSLGRSARKGSPVELAGWNDLLKVPASSAAKNLLAKFVKSSNPAETRLIQDIAKRVVGIKVKSGDKDIELIVDCAPFPRKLRLSLSPPWTGSVKGLPKELANAITTCNGMRLSIGKAEWYQYKGAAGFAFDWAAWKEMYERGKEIVEKPLVPFGNGEDIWCYAPSSLGGSSPRLARVSHESGELEQARRDNPAVLFLGLIQKVIKEGRG